MIFINGRFLTQPITGVQRYSLELLRALDQLFTSGALPLKEQERLVCLVPPDCPVNPDWANIEVRRVGQLKGNLWEQVDLPQYTKGQRLFSPANIGPYSLAGQVVTIHDASVFAVPEAYSFSFRTKYRVILNRMIKTSCAIITDSEFSKQELVRFCNMPNAPMRVIPLGSDHLMHIAPDEEFIQRAGLDHSSYLLAVSSQSPHKNLYNLIKAFVQLKDVDVELVLVGGKFGRVFQSADLILPARTRYLGYVNDAELHALYRHALGYIFPSYYEGFGLPVLEAMQAGCPVICAQAASIPEVGGEAALYCDPSSPEDITHQMHLLVNHPGLREDLVQKGKRQAQRFTWETTAHRTWAVLTEV